MSRLTLVLVCLGQLVAVAPLAAPAHAQSAEESALARESFEAGVAHSQERRWDEAVDAFARSYALAERTSTLFNLASALTQAGRLVEARERYRSYLNAGDDAALRAEAERAIAAIEPRVGRVRISAPDLQPVDELLFDGAPLNHAALGAAIPADPGEHHITVRRGGAELASERVTVSEGGEMEVRLALPPIDASVATTAGADSGSTLGDETQDDDEGGSVFASPWFWLTTGLILVAGGVVAAVLLVNEAQRLPLYEGTTDPPSLGLP